METNRESIDLDILRRNTLNDLDLLSELVDAFQSELPSVLSDISNGDLHHDSDVIAKAAHKIKGGLLILGARCAQTAEQLEMQARNGWTDSVHDLCAELEYNAKRLVPTLQTLVLKGEL
jgi:HPt (histidine-containing phosphotransfer) domain-containing protein